MAGDVKVSGPLFDGQAEAAIRRGIEAARQQVAEEGAKLARSAFAGSIRVEHGRFLGSIVTTDRSRSYTTASGRHSYSMDVTVDSSTQVALTTDLASYGPWLEGTGSRNQTTRFKGYHGFRRAAQQLDGIAGDVAGRALAPYIREAND